MTRAADRTSRPSLPVIIAITVTGITVNTLITASIPDILDGLGVSSGYAGLLVAAATLPGIVLAPVIGVLADRYGRREVLVPCLVVFGIAGGAASFAGSLWMMVVLRFVQGAGSAGLINLAIVLIGDHWEGTDRARLIGRNAAILTVCLALFPALGGVLADVGSWRTPFLVYPVAVLTAVGVAVGIPRSVRREQSVRDQVTEALPYIRDPVVVAVLAAMLVIFSLIFGFMLTVLPIHIEQAFGLAPAWRGAIIGLPAVGSTTTASNLGRLTARLGRRRLLPLGAGLITVALATIALAPSLPVLLVGALLFGLGEGCIVPSLQDMAAGAAPASSRGAVVAMLVSASRVGQTVGPLVASAMYAVAGALPTFALGAATALLALLPMVRRAAVDAVARA